MGNIFSGEMEDLILYGVIPGSALIVLLALVYALLFVHSLLRAYEASWPSRPINREFGALYRLPAVEVEKGAPLRVRRLAYALVIWAVANVVLWATLAAVAAAVGVYWFLGSAVLSLVALAQVIRSAFSLCDRADARARPRLHRARIWIIAHHVLAFGVGTALFVLLMLTTQFFRDGGDHPTRLMGQLVGAYLVGVIVPALAAPPFVRALHSIAPLYVASPEESGEHLT